MEIAVTILSAVSCVLFLELMDARHALHTIINYADPPEAADAISVSFILEAAREGLGKTGPVKEV